MGNRKILRTTTRTHGMALSMYLMIFVLGVLHTFDIASHVSMDNMIGVANTQVWALWHFPTALFCLGGAMIAASSSDPRLGTWVEFVGCAWVVLLQGTYLIALVQAAGGAPLQGPVTTQVQTLGLLIGAAVTMIQILWDQYKVSKGIKQASAANEHVLAEPVDTTSN